MSVYLRFFRVTGGPLMERAREIEASNEAANNVIKPFLKEIGATNILAHSDGRLSGFTFADTPDQGVWKQPNRFNAYMPRKNTAAGREILARVEALPHVLHISNAVRVIGLDERFPALVGYNSGYCVALTGRARLGVLFLTVPWYDKSPDEIEKYRRDRAAGNHFCCSLDHLCWEPSAGLVEVQRWEAEKEIAELNERVQEMARREREMSTSAEDRARCAVRGIPRPGWACGSVIVGGEFCGRAGECQHKIPPTGPKAENAA